jgi:histidinol-phosphatase (PHP family)
MIDLHIHSILSGDSREKPEDIFRAAKSMCLFCAAEHVNFLAADPDCLGVTDFEEFFGVYNGLRAKYPRIPAAIGVELGYLDICLDKNIELAKKYPFEILINSVHEVEGEDCYFPKFFVGKERDYAYTEYFKVVDKSLDVPYEFSALGHLAYLERNAPYPDRAVKYSQYEDLLDSILTKLIASGSALEINTSTKTAATPFLPNAEILSRYYSLGGRLVCYGSDAHTLADIGRKYEVAVAAAKAAGFKNWSVKLLRDSCGYKKGIAEFKF